MKIYVNDGNKEITFDLCACRHEHVNPKNLIALPMGSSSNVMNPVGVFHNHVVNVLKKNNAQPRSEKTLELLVKIGKEYPWSTDMKEKLGKFNEDEFMETCSTAVIGGCIPIFPPRRYPDYFDDFLKNVYLGFVYEVRNFNGATSDVHAIYQKLLDAEETVINGHQSREDKESSLAMLALATNTLGHWHAEALDNKPTGDEPTLDVLRPF